MSGLPFTFEPLDEEQSRIVAGLQAAAESLDRPGPRDEETVVSDFTVPQSGADGLEEFLVVESRTMRPLGIVHAYTRRAAETLALVRWGRDEAHAILSRPRLIEVLTSGYAQPLGRVK